MTVSPARVRTTNPRNVIVEFTRAIIDRAIERPDRVATAEIHQQVMERFGTDQAFLLNLALMNVDEIIKGAINEAIAETRRAPTMSQRRAISNGYIVTEQEQLAQAPAMMQMLAIRWGRFREWNGQHKILLLKMTRADLLAAARIRRERARIELKYALFFERLAERLPDDETTVEAAVPVDVIEDEYAEAEARAREEVGPDDTAESSDG